jgi:esterase/lipase superfamily enzyme
MELLSFGHAGTPTLVFPTSRGRFFEYENNGMIHALAEKIDAGQLYVYCVDSIDKESWYNRSIHPHERVLRQIAYESYVLFEVVPLMKSTSGGQQIRTTGCSLGGYQALNFAMRHPDVTAACVAMSGSFDMTSFMDDYYDQDFYYNNPVDYLPNMSDPWFLDRYRAMKLILAAGDWDISLGESQRMAEILGRKNIPHWLDIWTGGEHQDWPLWLRMAQKFF